MRNRGCQSVHDADRIMRKALSFSKKLVNYIGAIWYFIHDYNARICACLEPITTC